MQPLLAMLREQGHRAKSYVDHGWMLDRAAAARAGLGWLGKNTNLLVPGTGSSVLLAEIVTSAQLDQNEPVKKSCGSCDACLRVCPTGALVAPGVLDNRRCISFWTIEHRGVIPLEMRPLIGDWIFGCDLCQEVCPINAGARPALPDADAVQAFGPPLEPRPRLEELLRLADEGCPARSRGSAVWRMRPARLLQPDDAAFSAPRHGPRHVERGAGRGTARDDEGIGQRDPALELGDLRLDPFGEIRGHDHEVLLQLVVLGRVGRQLGADREELALDPQDDRVPLAIRDQGASGTQRGDCLIDRPICFGARIGFRYPASVEKSGLPSIAGLGDDALARHRRSPRGLYAAPPATTCSDQPCRMRRWLGNASGGRASGANHPICWTSSRASSSPPVNRARYAR